MENSFYYFFSSTPQVLSGILALFGVFVIFKIQSLKGNLLGSGQEFLDEFERNENVKTIVNNANKYLESRLKKAIHKQDVHLLKEHIKNLVIIINTPSFIEKEEAYNFKIKFLDALIKDTIKSSIFTACLIVLCLVILPFGKLLLSNLCILSLVFLIVIMCLTYIIIILVKIIIKSLKE